MTPKAYTSKSPSGHLLPDSGPTPKIIFCMQSLKHSSLSIVAFLMLSRAPPPVALLGFPNVREKEKRLNPPFHDPTCDASFSFHKHYFANRNGEDVRK